MAAAVDRRAIPLHLNRLKPHPLTPRPYTRHAARPLPLLAKRSRQILLLTLRNCGSYLRPGMSSAQLFAAAATHYMTDVLRVEADHSDARLPTGRVTGRSLEDFFAKSALRARKANTRATLAQPLTKQPLTIRLRKMPDMDMSDGSSLPRYAAITGAAPPSAEQDFRAASIAAGGASKRPRSPRGMPEVRAPQNLLLCSRYLPPLIRARTSNVLCGFPIRYSDAVVENSLCRRVAARRPRRTPASQRSGGSALRSRTRPTHSLLLMPRSSDTTFVAARAGEWVLQYAQPMPIT